MEPATKGVSHIRAPRLGRILTDGASARESVLRGVGVIHLHREAELARVILDDEDRIGRDVVPALDRMEVHDRDPFDHRAPQPAVVPVLRVDSAIRVAQGARLKIEGVVVRAADRRRDGDRELASGRPGG